MPKTYEIRDPVHGFIKLNEWERDIINQPAFQRLRRIKQLAWTDMVYPGATHSRFEHSLGVMHVISGLFDAIRERQTNFLTEQLHYRESGFERLRALLRIAALLHDVGHGPFSHAAEDIFPNDPKSGKAHVHEEYSAAIVKFELRDVIENHPVNRNHGLTADDVAAFFLETSPSRDSVLWQDLLSSQMDGDRMDYLLRDAYHAGVNYGKYDLNRIMATVALLERPDKEGFALGIDEDGIHAAEGLILARYMMFTQLYFHKTRVIYDYHLVEALKEILKSYGGHFPPPDSAENIRSYLEWDDWRVLGAFAAGQGGQHGEILKGRNHYRKLRETSEVPGIDELGWIDELEEKLAPFGAVRKIADKSWYKFQKLNDEILVRRDSSKKGATVVPLSQLSSVVKGLESVKQRRIYVPCENRENAEAIAREIEQRGDEK